MVKSRNDLFLKRIAERSKELREKHGVTQEEFYNDTGINIGRIERAKRDFSMTTLYAICEYYEITVSEFFEGIK